MPNSASQKQPLAIATQRARQFAKSHLRPGTVQRIRLAKWAVAGTPPTVRITTSNPKTGPDRRRAKAKVRPGGPVPSVPGKSNIEVRRDCAFATADRAGKILEIGPAHHATMSRTEGFDTRNADHTDQAGLLEKYRHDPNVDVSRIEEVDYVLTPGVPMAETIQERFELVVAAHVLEHSTSLVTFINDCLDLLQPGGTLALTVPDHRFCFDRFRERTSLAAAIDAARRNPGVHSVGTQTDMVLNVVRRENAIAWGPASGGRYTWIHNFEDAVKLAADMSEEAYVDTHHWVFTPHHLRLLLHDLHATGYLKGREAFFHDSVGCEFYINLQVEGPGPNLTRAELVERSDAERRYATVGRFAPSIAAT